MSCFRDLPYLYSSTTIADQRYLQPCCSLAQLPKPPPFKRQPALSQHEYLPECMLNTPGKVNMLV
jgi:hypothetical protein